MPPKGCDAQPWWKARKARQQSNSKKPLHVDLPGVSRRTVNSHCEPMYVRLPMAHVAPYDGWAEPLTVQITEDVNVDDTEWARRLAHRTEGTRAVKRTKDYTAAWTAQVPRPRTPDPTRRDLSKRAWERAMQEWRHGLKGVVSQMPPVQRLVNDVFASILADVLARG